MELVQEGKRWEAISAYGEWEAKEAGFRWDPSKRRWWTDSKDKAARLATFAVSPQLQAELETHADAQAEEANAARATDADIAIPAPDGLEYMPFQRAGIAYALNRPATLNCDQMGLGKAQPIDAPVLTPTGYRKMGDLEVGDLVIGATGKPTKITGVFPQGAKPINRVTFSDKSSAECCDDHLWEVTTMNRKWLGKPPRVMSLAEISERGTHDGAGNRKWEIPLVAAPVDFDRGKSGLPRSIHLPISPWLLGVLLGDGGLRHGRTMISTKDPEILERITSEVAPLDLHVSHSAEYDYLITHGKAGKPNPITNVLRDLNLSGLYSHEKFVPQSYKLASPADRLEMLRGLMDTDGWVNKGKRGNAALFGTSSDRLADDVVFLIESLGGVARRRLKKISGYRDAHLITVSLPSGVQPFWLPRKAELYPNLRPKYQPTRKIESVEFSRLAEAQCIKVEAPDGLYLTDRFIVTHNTIEAIGVINGDPSVQKVLVVCPASLRINWRRELEKWLVRPLTIGIATSSELPNADVVIVNYDILHRHTVQLRWVEWDVLIADECFPAGTMVETDHGPIPIDDIVNRRLPVNVACVSSHNETVFRPVTRYVRKQEPHRMMRIRHTGGELTCTPNHKVWSERGYVLAEEIQAGETLRMVRGSVRLSRVPDPPLLQQAVLGTVASEASATIPGNDQETHSEGWLDAAGDKATGRLGENEAPQFRPGVSRQTGCRIETAERKVIHRTARGQRHNHTTAGSPPAGPGAPRGSNGARHPDGTGGRPVPFLADVLQSGPGVSGGTAGHRSGRAVTQDPALEVPGSAQGIRLESVRVESVEVLERGDRPGSSDGFVYNLEVEEHHNYFADGILVGNCHYIKNPKARRTIQVLGKWNIDDTKKVDPIPAKRRLFLTGTPIVNRPVELHPILRSIDRKEWGNWRQYVTRYCGGFQTEYGWDVSGASNLDELQDRLRATCMVRRLKADVLTDLPAKRRQVIELPENGCISAIRAERQASERGSARLRDLRAAVEMAKVSDDPEDYKIAVAALREGVQAHFTTISRLRMNTAVAKVPYVADHIREVLDAGTAKVIVFAHHHAVTDRLAAEFGADAVRLDGRDKMEDRDLAVRRFQEDPSVKVFLGGIQAAGVGLTLTAAAHVIFAELDWVPGNLSQAEDRCHRIGQTASVLVQHLVLEGSIDATMAQRLVDKQEVIDLALDAEPTEEQRAARDLPILPSETVPVATATATQTEIALEAETLGPDLIALIHDNIRELAARCDGAQAEDGTGFNKFDAPLGHQLAALPSLTAKQAALARRIARKYRGQLGDPTHLHF